MPIARRAVALPLTAPALAPSPLGRGPSSPALAAASGRMPRVRA